jgi:LPS-assembly lipoprotein
MTQSRAILVALLLGSLAAPLGACGFTPLYAESTLTSGMTHIQVVAPDGREGYLLREALDDELGHDKGSTPEYRLEMEVGQNRIGLGLRPDATSQRFEYDMTVNYVLVEAATGKVVHKGTVQSNISYDSTPQPYASISARSNTQDLLAADAARKIRLDLAAWMTRQPG